MPLIYYYYTNSHYRDLDSNPNPNPPPPQSHPPPPPPPPPKNYNTTTSHPKVSSSNEYPITLTSETKNNGTKVVKECIKLKTSVCSKLNTLKEIKEEHKL